MNPTPRTPGMQPLPTRNPVSLNNAQQPPLAQRPSGTMPTSTPFNPSRPFGLIGMPGDKFLDTYARL